MFRNSKMLPGQERPKKGAYALEAADQKTINSTNYLLISTICLSTQGNSLTPLTIYEFDVELVLVVFLRA